MNDSDLNAVTPMLGTANDVVGAVNAAPAPAAPVEAPGAALVQARGPAAPESSAVHGGIAGPISILAGLATLEQSNRNAATATNRDQRVNANLGRANGALTFGSGSATTAHALRQAVRANPASHLPGAANALSTVAGGVETAQGVYNTLRGMADWDHGGETATQQVSDGVTQTVHGGASMFGGITGSPLMAAGAAGFGAGTAWVNAADAQARQNGTFGDNHHARVAERGLGTGGPLPARSSSEAAADAGVHVRDRLRPAIGDRAAWVAGAAATVPAALGTAMYTTADAMTDGRLSSSDAVREQHVTELPATPQTHATPAQIAQRGGTRISQMAAGLPAALQQAHAAGQTEPTVTEIPGEADARRAAQVRSILGVTGSGPPVFPQHR